MSKLQSLNILQKFIYLPSYKKFATDKEFIDYVISTSVKIKPHDLRWFHVIFEYLIDAKDKQSIESIFLFLNSYFSPFHMFSFILDGIYSTLTNFKVENKQMSMWYCTYVVNHIYSLKIDVGIAKKNLPTIRYVLELMFNLDNPYLIYIFYNALPTCSEYNLDCIVRGIIISGAYKSFEHLYDWFKKTIPNFNLQSILDHLIKLNDFEKQFINIASYFDAKEWFANLIQYHQKIAQRDAMIFFIQYKIDLEKNPHHELVRLKNQWYSTKLRV